MVVARDTGPGIADLDLAMSVGYTTYGGRGLGLPGARRLMDEFEITSELGLRHHRYDDEMASEVIVSRSSR